MASGRPRAVLATASASSLAVSQGGNYRLAHTHALQRTAVRLRLGQSPNDARRPCSVQHSCPPQARLSIASTLLSHSTALPLSIVARECTIAVGHIAPPMVGQAVPPGPA